MTKTTKTQTAPAATITKETAMAKAAKTAKDLAAKTGVEYSPAINDQADRAECACGCGNRVVGKKSQFRMGHDARHVSNLVNDLVDGHNLKSVDLADLPGARSELNEVRKAIAAKFSDRLAGKYEAAAQQRIANVVDRINKRAAKADAKAAKAERESNPDLKVQVKAEPKTEAKPKRDRSAAAKKAAATRAANRAAKKAAEADAE